MGPGSAGPALPGRVSLVPLRELLLSPAVYPVQAQFLGDALDGTRQLHAQRVRVAAQPGGDFHPAIALVLEVHQLPLVGAEPAGNFLEQVLGLELLARAGTPRRNVLLL